MWLPLFVWATISLASPSHSYPIGFEYDMLGLDPQLRGQSRPYIHAQLDPGQRVRIECNPNDPAFIYGRLSSGRIGDTDIAELINCTLATNLSVRKLFERLDIRNVHTLRIAMASVDGNATTDAGRLSDYAFDGLQSVRRLHLSGNRLPSLGRRLFDGITSMSLLNVSGATIDSIDGDAFERLTGLKQLWLHGELDQLPDGLLTHLSALIDVRISGCKCRRLPAQLFAGSPNIETLSLAHNELEQLPAKLLDAQVNLLDLDLSYNALVAIDDVLLDAETLKVLRLSYNRLSIISVEPLSGLWALEELYLDNNNIHTIDVLAFEHTVIRVLDLANNSLDMPNIDDATPFNHLGRLSVLSMRNNSMSSFLSVWNTYCFQLEHLDLSHNSITTLNLGMVVDFWTKPITVDLSHNQIATVVTAYDEYQPNSTWILTDNPLRCDCMIQPFAKRIQMQPSRNGKVRFVADDLRCAAPERFAGQPLLDVAVTQLTCPLDGLSSPNKLCPPGCECYVRTVDRTLVFNCSNANLADVPALPDKAYLGSIRSYHLHIENNRISRLPLYNVTGYMDVNYIYARNNSIDSVQAYQLPNDLNVLDVSANRLQWLGYDVLSHLGRMQTLKNVSLHDNPWACDCAAADLQRFLRVNATKIIAVRNITCSNVDDNRPLVDSYLCVWRDLAIALIATATMMCIFVLACMVMFHTHRLKALICMDAYRKHFTPLVFLKNRPESKEFDAFIAHSSKDVDFVHCNLVKQLEHGDRPLKLRLLDRDVLGGACMHNVVTDFVKTSRKTIVVLTPNLMDSIKTRGRATQDETQQDAWNLMAFLLAHQCGLQDRNKRVIIIILGDIGPIENLPCEIKAYLDLNLYLRCDERNFFHKLRFAIDDRYPLQIRRDHY